MRGRRLVVVPERDRPLRPRSPGIAVVVGGGIAGCTAATVLAERGVRVTLHEAGAQLGGGAPASPFTLSDGTTATADHGFHAFFRQYYNLRAVIGRVGVRLVPVADY